MSRMWRLIALGRTRKLTEAEEAELQRLFIRVALNDVRVLNQEKLAGSFKLCLAIETGDAGRLDKACPRVLSRGGA